MTKLTFAKLGAEAAPEVPLPPAPKSPGNYGLVFDGKRKQLFYAPSTQHHAAGEAWAWDGRSWVPVASGTARGSSISQSWRAVFDTARGAVVVWSWDYSTGPIGIVVGKGGAKPEVLSSGQGGTKAFEGAVPTLREDTKWDRCHALFGFDEGRGVTVCVNEVGLWELEGARWTQRTAALGALPKEVEGSGFMSNGFGAVYDRKHARVVFWAEDSNTLVLVSWDGKTLERLDTRGLPELGGFSGGFVVGDHPDHGVVVLSGTGDARLFGLAKKGGGFSVLPAAGPGGPGEFSSAQLAFDPARRELVLGPQKTSTDEHRFYILGAKGWRALGRSVTKSVLGDTRWTFVTTPRATYGVNGRGEVVRWDGTAHRWTEVLSAKEVDGVIAAPIHVVVRGWDERVHAVSTDGAVFRLDDAKGLAWKKIAAKTKDFGAESWPLSAFDPSRGLLVVWGERKKKGRKDDTFVFDGKTWSKAKKGKAKTAGIDYDRDDPFTLFYDEGAHAVARLSDTEIAHFDGAGWSCAPHRGGKLATAWSQVVCAVPGKADVLLVKRHMGEREVVRLRRAKSGYTLTRVATFEAPHSRGPNDTGGNASFDLGWFDPAQARLVAHFPEDDSLTYALDLGKLFEG